MTYEQQVLRRDLNRTRDEIGAAQRGIKELERARDNDISMSMVDEYNQAITNKQASLKELVLQADSLKEKLINAESPETKQAIKENPYAHVKRSMLDDETRAHIASEYGADALLKMPL